MGFFVIKPLPISDNVKDILNLLLGVLTGTFKDVVGYYFGSSLGSDRKTELLSQKDGQ